MKPAVATTIYVPMEQKKDASDVAPSPLRLAIRTQLGWLRTVALARLRDRDAVEEVLQNTAVAAMDAQRRGISVQRPESWLYRVLVRQCLLHRRRLGRRRQLTQRFKQHAVTSSAQVENGEGRDIHAAVTRESAVDPLRWLLADERRGMVREALQTLPTGDAEVLLLKHVENWTYRRIAEHLGVSQSTVESRLFRARRRLRIRLKEIFDD